MAFIYKITNDINDKVYIGKTIGSVQKRFREHCQDRTKRPLENRPLYRAMNKYGVEHFTVEQIEETDMPEEREVYWIKQYDSYHNGYNATLGGDGKHYIDYEKIYQLFLQGKTEKEIAKEVGCCSDTCQFALYSYGISPEEIANNGYKRTRKPVMQIDIKTGEILQTFPSIKAAHAAMGVFTRGHIGKVCNGQRQSAYGYKWQFVGDL